MKEWINKRKIILIICAVIMIAGLIMFFIKGFNKEQYYSANMKLEVYIENGYDKNTIKEIAKESFGDKEFNLEEIEKLGQVVAIRIKNPSEEEIETFKNKIMEKYQIDMPTVRIRTFVEPYIFPIILITILSLIFVGIISKKSKKIIENICKIIIKLIIISGVYFSILLICRLQFGTYTMPIALAIYLLTLLVSVNKIQK